MNERRRRRRAAANETTKQKTAMNGRHVCLRYPEREMMVTNNHQ